MKFHLGPIKFNCGDNGNDLMRFELMMLIELRVRNLSRHLALTLELLLSSHLRNVLVMKMNHGLNADFWLGWLSDI